MVVAKALDEIFNMPGDIVKCEVCCTEVDKFIQMSETGILCRDCAQRIMRILFQDLIEYDNGIGVSCADILYHGDSRKEKGGKLYAPVSTVRR